MVAAKVDTVAGIGKVRMDLVFIIHLLFQCSMFNPVPSPFGILHLKPPLYAITVCVALKIKQKNSPDTHLRYHTSNKYVCEYETRT